MKLAREIAEDFFKDWDDEHDGVAIGLSAGVLAHIIAAKLEPVREAHRQVVNCTARVRNEGCRFCSDASKCLDDLMDALALLSEEE